MRRARCRLPPAFTTAIALAALVAGCAGGSSSSSTSAGSTVPGVSGEPSSEFLNPKSATNKFVTFGSEASATEREGASEVLEENLEARASAEFTKQCATLNESTIKEITGPLVSNSKCPRALESLAEPLKNTKKIRADTLGGPIAALRIKGPSAYALFHGRNGNDYAMPMEKEGSTWKVGALLETELESPQRSSQSGSAAAPTSSAQT